VIASAAAKTAQLFTARAARARYKHLPPRGAGLSSLLRGNVGVMPVTWSLFAAAGSITLPYLPA
jgi:hypothetical protein